MIKQMVKVAAISALLSSAAVVAQIEGGGTSGSGVSGVSAGLNIDFAGGNNTAGTSNNNNDTGGLAASIEKAFANVECKTPGEDC